MKLWSLPIRASPLIANCRQPYATKMRNVGFLGYADGENKFTYPEFSNEKAKNLIDAVSSVADYVIVDCSNDDKCRRTWGYFLL